MLKKLIFICCAIFIISSCVHMKVGQSLIYNQYIEYAHSVTKENVMTDADKYFSKSLLGADYKSGPDAPVLLTFHTRMVEIDSYAEMINNRNGCLVINGYNDRHEPLI